MGGGGYTHYRASPYSGHHRGRVGRWLRMVRFGGHGSGVDRIYGGG